MMIEYLLILIIILLIIVIFYLVYKQENFYLFDKVKSFFNNNDNDNIINNDLVINDFIDEKPLSSDEYVKEINDLTLINDFNKKSKYIDNKNTSFFTNTLFHPDYIDVINVLNKMQNTPNNILFNQNNKKTETYKGENSKAISDIIEKFIDNINDKMKNEPKTEKELLKLNKWDNQPDLLSDLKYDDGFEMVRNSLGLPKKLYNSSVYGINIELVDYSNIIVEKVLDSNEKEYSVDITVKRNGSRDKMIFKLKFIIINNKIIIDNINIIGFNNDRDIDPEYKDIDKFYQFDNLNKHNITSVGDILSSMKDKYGIKEKMMQDNIDNLHPEDKLMNMRINPYQYEATKATRTYYDDIWEKPLWE